MFITVLDVIMKAVNHENSGINWKLNGEFAYADDIVLLSYTAIRIVLILTRLR